MSDREELEKLRKSQGALPKKGARQELEELRSKQNMLGIKLPGGVRIGVTGPIADDTPGFFKNAAMTAANRVQQLGNKVSGNRVSEETKQLVDNKVKEGESKPGGSTGVFLGDTVATLPFAGVGKGLQATRALLGGGRIARAATSAPAAAAAEGALIGGLINDDAAGGAGAGVLLNTVGRGAGKLLTGPVSKSAEAKALQQMAQAQGMPLQLPVGVAAANPLVRKAFGDVLPSLPGAQRAMSVQKRSVQSQLDDLALARGVPPQSTESLLGADIRSPGPLENRMAWALASATGTAPQIIPAARALSSPVANKALLGDYKIQQKLGKLGEKIKPITAALRRVVTLEAGEDE